MRDALRGHLAIKSVWEPDPLGLLPSNDKGHKAVLLTPIAGSAISKTGRPKPLDDLDVKLARNDRCRGARPA
jgi:hypothetical protein